MLKNVEISYKVDESQKMLQKPYEKLKFYQDICHIRILVVEMTLKFNKTNIRLISQMRDAARSAKQNIREGYLKGSLGEFKHSIRISQGSLEELSGDIEDCLQDKLISKDEFEKFQQLYKSAMYMSTQYMKAMAQDRNIKSWRVPFKEKPKAT